MQKYELENEEFKWLELERELEQEVSDINFTPKLPSQGLVAPHRGILGLGQSTKSMRNQETLITVEFQEEYRRGE